MAQDENFVSSSNSAGSCGGDVGSAVSSSHSRSKIAKQKKAPQRGLGVAQLERLRLEEQRNRAPGPANALPNNAIGPAHSPVSSPASPPANSNLPPPPPLFRSVVGPSAPNDEMGLRGVSSWPRLWGGEYNNHHNYLEGGEKQRVDHHHHHHHNVGFAFGPQINLTMQHETNSPVSPFPGDGGPQWSFQFQRPPSSSVTNVSSGISPSSLSSSQMEPPSIQSVRGNNYSPSWSEDDKIAVGMKRAYPFNLESPPPPTPSFLANFHASGSRSDEFPSCSNEPRNKYIRDGCLSLTPGLKQIPVEETRLFGDLLTLAPPVAAAPATPLSSKNKHPLDYFDRQGLDLSDNRNFSSQETMRSSQTHQAGPSTSTEQPFSFFPIKPQTDKTSTHARNGNGEKGEILDLNLKL